MIRIDDLIHPGDPDHTAAFVYASQFEEVELSRRNYLMNGCISIKEGQQWRLNGAKIYHTDPSKIMFRADEIGGWYFGGGVLQGTLTEQGSAAERGLMITGCDRYTVENLDCRLFLGLGLHIAAGTFSGSKSDQGMFSNIRLYENMKGLLVEVGTGAEYNTFTSLHAVGNIIGVDIAAGNTTIVGGNICENTYGLSLNGGTNNGHGIISAVNINHNAYENARFTDVTNGFTLADCHFYNNGSGTSLIKYLGSTADVCIDGGVVDSQCVHDASGTNRIQNAKRYAQFLVSGSTSANLIQANNY